MPGIVQNLGILRELWYYVLAYRAVDVRNPEVERRLLVVVGNSRDPPLLKDVWCSHGLSGRSGCGLRRYHLG